MTALVRVDPDTRQAWQGDRNLDLTPLRFNLLNYLVRNAGKAVTRDEIIREVWGSDWLSRGTVAMQIHWLRLALNDDHQQAYIATVRGIGYRFDPDLVAQESGPWGEISRLQRELAAAHRTHVNLSKGMDAAGETIRAALLAARDHGPSVGIRVLRERAALADGLLDGLDLPAPAPAVAPAPVSELLGVEPGWLGGQSVDAYVRNARRRDDDGACSECGSTEGDIWPISVRPGYFCRDCCIKIIGVDPALSV